MFCSVRKAKFAPTVCSTPPGGVTKTEYVLMRQDAGGEQGQVLGHRKANATAQQDEEQPDEACLPAQDAADSDGPVRIPSVLVKNVPDT